MHDFLKNIFDFWALTSFFKFESVDQPRYATLFCYPKPFLYKFRKFCKQSFREKKTRIHWLGRQILRKQLNIMPTYQYVQNQGKLMTQSRENGQKPQYWLFFDNFEVKCLQIENLSEE